MQRQRFELAHASRLAVALAAVVDYADAAALTRTFYRLTGTTVAGSHQGRICREMPSLLPCTH